MWDGALFVLLAGAFVLMARAFVNAVWSRVDSPRSCAAAVLLAVLPVAILAVAAGELVSLIAEGVRVSNLGHLAGFRGDRIPWRHHRPAILSVAVVLFLSVAIVHAWRRPDRGRP